MSLEIGPRESDQSRDRRPARPARRSACPRRAFFGVTSTNTIAGEALMSRTTPALAALVALACAAAPLAAQDDTGMMAHDSGMMAHDSGMTAHDPGMMAHDSAMMDHGEAMGDKMTDDDKMMHDSGAAMRTDRMFLGAGDAKASGEYEIVEADGKRKLKLTPDFAVPAARDLYLVLATGDEPGDGALYLGKLSQPAGEQAFELPKGKDLSGYTRLLVWSKKEKRAVASAPWHPEDWSAMDKM
jgi:hypothetical protein